MERDKERRRLRSHCTTQAMSDAVVAQKSPGPSGSSIFGPLRRCFSVMCRRGHTTFVAPCTGLKTGTPNSQLYYASTPKALRQRRLLSAATFFLLFVSLATDVCTEDVSLEQRIQATNIPIYRLSGESWITLPDLAFLFKGTINRDVLSRRTEISFGNHKLVVLPGSKKVLYDDAINEMNQPARIIAGVEAIPYDFASLIASVAFIPSFQPVPTTTTEEPPKTEPTSPPGIVEILAGVSKKADNEITLVLDAGHGGDDKGAIGPWGLQEKDVNLDLVLRLSEYLKRSRPKLKVVMTRKDDTFIPLPDRAEVANQLGADFFVSIHTNSARYNHYTADGFETYSPTFKPTVFACATNPNDEISDILKETVPYTALQKSQYLASLVQEKLADRLITPDRGVKRKNFYVLKYTYMVSVLVEVGFICNPNIEANLRIPEVRQAIAEAIGGGIIAYLDGQPLKSRVTVDTQRNRGTGQ